MRSHRLTSCVASVALALAAGSSHAVLERTGPIDPANGFPLWYQDTTGLTLELCLPLNQAELDAGACLLLPGDPPTVPEVFPSAFFDEHFWWAANATISPPNGINVILVLAAEAAFVLDVTPGGQIAFTRIRVRLDPAPVTGTYRFVHPYGEEIIEAQAGDRIFFTDDVGIECPPGEFSCAGLGRIGPFLLASDTPGGPELAAVPGPVPGKLYIADPARLGPVTGSPLADFTASDGLPHNHNVFRVEGPPGSNLDGAGNDFVETTDFALTGRLFGGQIAGLVTTDRAVYESAPTFQKIDVFATAFSTGQSRLPGAARPPGIDPVMSFYDGPCTVITDPGDPNRILGFAQPVLDDPLNPVTEILMTADGTRRWGQVQLSSATVLPDSVCVKDNSALDQAGTPVPAYHQLAVRDGVTIVQAIYDTAAEALTVDAISSDLVNPPTLTVAEFGADLVNGTVTIPGVSAPPATIHVSSAARGMAAADVITDLAAPPPGFVTPLAVNDPGITLDEDSAATPIPVLANDTLDGSPIDPALATLRIIVNGARGTGVINTTANTIDYLPNANANGADTLSYTVTVNGVESNVATVSIAINPINDPPVAVADTAAGTINVAVQIPVLANDSDVDGDPLQIDAAAGSELAILSSPAAAVASAVVNADGTVSFTGDLAGQYTFQYTATDGLLQDTATVTVDLAGAETLVATRAEFVQSKGRWRVEGTTDIAAGHQVTAVLSGTVAGAPCNADGRVIGSGITAAGALALDFTVAIGSASDPRTTDCDSIRLESVLGGVSPDLAILLK
ncbi:MAG: cadherin-like domain-containing protein [Rhodocyclaceae bacterium]|nr:cadherin-like domain-containing protein [Rhodocyclaceae bacterium]